MDPLCYQILQGVDVVDLEVKYRSDNTRQNSEWLCFKHAVTAALNGENIITEIDDFGSEYDMRDTSCADCGRERGA